MHIYFSIGLAEWLEFKVWFSQFQKLFGHSIPTTSFRIQFKLFFFTSFRNSPRKLHKVLCLNIFSRSHRILEFTNLTVHQSHLPNFRINVFISSSVPSLFLISLMCHSDAPLAWELSLDHLSLSPICSSLILKICISERINAYSKNRVTHTYFSLRTRRFSPRITICWEHCARGKCITRAVVYGLQGSILCDGKTIYHSPFHFLKNVFLVSDQLYTA